MPNIDIQALITQAIPLVGNVLLSIVILVVGSRIARFVRGLILKSTNLSNLDSALSKFLASFAYYAILAFLVMAVLGRFGIETTSFVALIGAMGLAVGLAFEGALSNFAAGILLIVFRPFTEGDWVEVADTMGLVQDIEIVTTKLITFENEAVIIPNSEITGGTIKNFSDKPYIEHEMEFFVDYQSDIAQAVEIIQNVLDTSEFTVAEPQSGAFVVEQTETAVKLLAEANIHPQDREDVQYDVTSRVMAGFKEAGINAPMSRWVTVNA